MLKGNIIKNYTKILNKSIIELSPNALKLYLVAIKNKDNWKFNRDHLQNESKLKNHTFSKALKELKSKGYYDQYKVRRDGRFTENDYIFYRIPKKHVDIVNEEGLKIGETSKTSLEGRISNLFGHFDTNEKTARLLKSKIKNSDINQDFVECLEIASKNRNLLPSHGLNSYFPESLKNFIQQFNLSINSIYYILRQLKDTPTHLIKYISGRELEVWDSIYQARVNHKDYHPSEHIYSKEGISEYLENYSPCVNILYNSQLEYLRDYCEDKIDLDRIKGLLNTYDTDPGLFEKYIKYKYTDNKATRDELYNIIPYALVSWNGTPSDAPEYCDELSFMDNNYRELIVSEFDLTIENIKEHYRDDINKELTTEELIKFTEGLIDNPIAITGYLSTDNILSCFNSLIFYFIPTCTPKLKHETKKRIYKFINNHPNTLDTCVDGINDWFSNYRIPIDKKHIKDELFKIYSE